MVRRQVITTYKVFTTKLDSKLVSELCKKNVFVKNDKSFIE